MDQQSGSGGMDGAGRGFGSEDASEAREHVRAAEENRDALDAQSRRTEATAPDSVSTPIGAANGGLRTSERLDASAGASGMPATGSSPVSEDASQAREPVRAAGENRDALADEHRRVESTTPPEVDTGR